MRILSILSILMILCGCSSGHKDERSAIAVSFEPQAWLIEQIAGDEFDIITLLPAGSDPESYQPSISTMRGLGNSDIFFTLGIQGFEKSLADNISSNFPDLKIIDCTNGIKKIYGSHGHSGHTANDSEEFDPHMLSSIRNCTAIAKNMAEALIELYPDKAEKFIEGSNNLISKLQAMDDSITGMNLKDKLVVIRHPSLSYYARDYGIRQISLQEDGKETPPLQLKRRLEEIKNSNPTVFVSEKEHASSSDEDVAKQLGINLIQVSLNSSDWLDDLMRLSNEINRN